MMPRFRRLCLVFLCAASLTGCQNLVGNATRLLSTPFNMVNRMFDTANRSIGRVTENSTPMQGPLRLESGEIERARASGAEGEFVPPPSQGLPDSQVAYAW